MPTSITPSGTLVNRTTAPPPADPGPETARSFIVGYTERGAVDRAVYVQSMADVQAEFGGRLSVSSFYDSMDAYFLLGGAGGYVTRNYVSTIGTATANLAGSTSGVALVVNAKNPGTWGNNTSVSVTNATTSFTVTVTAGSTVETSYSLASASEAVAWAAQYSKLVSFTVGGGVGLPATAASVALVGGTDNTATDTTSLSSALARFDDQYGPGTVLAPGYTANVLHQRILGHVANRPRTAALDLADGDAATAAAAAAALYNVAGRERATLNASTLILPGGPLGSTREVPWSVVIAAHASRADVQSAPGQALAGPTYGAVTSKGQPIPGAVLKRLYSEADQGLLEGTGVTYAEPQVVGGQINVPVTAADRTISDFYDKTIPTEYSDARVLMAVEARIRRQAQPVTSFASLGGDGSTVSKIYNACAGVAQDMYNAGTIGDGVMPYKSAFQLSVVPDRPGKRVIITALVYSAVSARLIQINIVHAVGA